MGLRKLLLKTLNSFCATLPFVALVTSEFLTKLISDIDWFFLIFLQQAEKPVKN
jgi:hypothetical protein